MQVSAAVLASIQWILTLESSPLVGRFSYFIFLSIYFFPPWILTLDSSPLLPCWQGAALEPSRGAVPSILPHSILLQSHF